MKNLRVGCSGYHYPEWKEKFYPKGLAPSKWLEYYSSVFNTVELNGTFYRKPKLADLKKYVRVTPDDFVFSVKASKYITHVLKLNEATEPINEFIGLIEEGLSDKLGNILFQLPPSFKYSEENSDRVFNSIPFSPKNVIEFRDISWWNKEILERFKQAGFLFCNVDFPGLQPPFVFTAPDFYLRLHGTPELFHSSYGKEQLETIYTEISPSVNSAWIYFNNTAGNAAYKNALSLIEIAKQKTR